MSRLRIAWRGSRLVLHVVIGIVLTPLVMRRDPATRVWRTSPAITSWWHGRVARILRLEISTSGFRPQAPALMVANHVSWLDIIVLGHLTPTCFLSKHEVRGWPVIGWLARAAGTLHWPDAGLLAVSDLHLGKSERFARRGGALLPPYEVRDTLHRLTEEVEATNPSIIIFLGDSFDDLRAGELLSETEIPELSRIAAGREIFWIEGNHDPGPVEIAGSHCGFG